MTPFPRWTCPWRHRPVVPVFLATWRLERGQPPLSARERDLVQTVLLHDHGGRCDLMALVVMDDHVHVLGRPAGVAADRLLRSWQWSSAHQLERLFRRSPPIWSVPSLRDVHSDGELRDLTARIVGNPWKRWPFIPGYRWVWDAESDAGGQAGKP